MGPVIRNVIRDYIRPVMGDEVLTRFTGILDEVPGAAFAGSTRVLSRAFLNDWIVQGYRASDKDEAQILGDPSADYSITLDSKLVGSSATLGDFAGVESVGVVKERDQSGNGRDAVQTTAANQPQIVSAGALVTGGIDFDGVNDFLQTTAFSAELVQPCRNFTVAKAGGTGTGEVIISGLTLAKRQQLYLSGATTSWDIFAGSALSGGTRDLTERLWSALFDGASSHLRIDGSEVSSGNAGTQALDGINIGADPGNAANWAGSINCAIVYGSSQTANNAAIEAKLADIYGITLA